ncbi:hypothetical protein [Streptomyces sp. NPDC055134]
MHDARHRCISGSPDGFVIGPGPEIGPAIGGEALHTWVLSEGPDDRRVRREAADRSGAVILCPM